MSTTTNVCRTILDTQTVVKERITEMLAEKLVSAGVEESVCRDLSVNVNAYIDSQTDSLLDRVTNELGK